MPTTILQQAVGRNGLLACIVLLHYLAALLVAFLLGQDLGQEILPFVSPLLTVVMPIFLMCVLLWRFYVLARHTRPSRPIAALARDLRSLLLSPERLATGAVALCLFLLFVQSFAFFKTLVPLESGIAWDVIFADADWVLHGGRDPFGPLMELFGNPYVITFLNGCYHFWFFLVYFVVIFACFSGGHRSRNVFLIAFVLTWLIGGNILAILLPSGGPVYFELMGYGGRFSPLLEQLARSDAVSPVWALDVHALLWEGYVGARPEVGISAMPSMHVASSVVIALYGFRHSRGLGVLLSLFATIIFIGSIVLAWHYAVDGYVGALVAVSCWALATRLTRSRMVAPQGLGEYA